MPWRMALLVLVCCGIIVRTMLRKAGIGTKYNKPDCGCGSGNNCTTKTD